MTLLYALILFGIIIFVHEFGHFLLAKLLGVKVEKFSLGFGPKVVGAKYGETEYLISAFPLGGYVKMLGESPGEEEELGEEDKRRAFNRQLLWKRFLIVFAGPFFNVLFAAVVFMFIFLAGIPVLEPVVGEVMEDSPALRAGLAVGDRITGIEDTEISEWSQMTDIIYESPEKELTFRISRAGEVFGIRITPERKLVKDIFGEDQEIGLIGIRSSGESFIKKYTAADAVSLGVTKTVDISGLTLLSIVKLIQRVIPADNLGGPILIFSIASERAEQGARSFFTFMAVISINLGIINLFPIPVLDGGHILFMGVEAVRKKPLGENTMMLAQKVGLALILMLLAFAFYNDIVRVITGKGIP
jgi:regulator of sigma E protease